MRWREINSAALMWAGGMGTDRIADRLNMTEQRVYNRIEEIKRRARTSRPGLQTTKKAGKQ